MLPANNDTIIDAVTMYMNDGDAADICAAVPVAVSTKTGAAPGTMSYGRNVLLYRDGDRLHIVARVFNWVGSMKNKLGVPFVAKPLDEGFGVQMGEIYVKLELETVPPANVYHWVIKEAYWPNDWYAEAAAKRIRNHSAYKPVTRYPVYADVTAITPLKRFRVS